MWESERPEKFSLLLIVLGFTIGIIGAVLTFAFGLSNIIFYLGFFIAIIGFAFAVLYRIREPKK